MVLGLGLGLTVVPSLVTCVVLLVVPWVVASVVFRLRAVNSLCLVLVQKGLFLNRDPSAL